MKTLDNIEYLLTIVLIAFTALIIFTIGYFIGTQNAKINVKEDKIPNEYITKECIIYDDYEKCTIKERG